MISKKGLHYLCKAKFYVIGCLACFFISLCWSVGFAQSSFQSGQNWYNQRSVKADSFHVSPSNINKAIRAFEESIKVNYRVRESAINLLKSLYFKGMHANISDDKRKRAFDRGRQWGEKMIRKYPESAALRYWYGLNLHQWDQMHNLWQTTIDRTDKKLRDVGQKIIAIDSTYQGGGGYRLLAQVHFETPGIWLVKGWPSNDKALELIRKAVKIAPDLPANRLFYAHMLIHFERKAEAKTQLLRLTKNGPRPSHLVEDRLAQYRAEKLLKKHFGPKKD